METNSWTATRTDGVYRVTRTTTYPPTQAALAEAARVETQAAEVVKASRAALSAALAVLKDTFEGDMMLAEVEFSSGRADAAFAALASALKRQPRSLEANQMVAELYRRLGRADDADRQMSLTVNLVQASAGWMLRTAWRKIADKDVAGARAALDAAKTLDPEDARVYAYAASIAASQGQAAEARAADRMALALNQAKLVMHIARDRRPHRAGAAPGGEPVPDGRRALLSRAALRDRRRLFTRARRRLDEAPWAAPGGRSLICKQGVDGLPGQHRLSDTGEGALMAATLDRVYRWSSKKA